MSPALKKQIVMGINLTTFLLLISVLTVSASSYGQKKITLNEKKANLAVVLDQIRQQSGYDIVSSDEFLQKSKPVTVNIKDASLEDALKECLKDQPLSYEIEDGTVVIKEKEVTFLDNIKSAFALIDVHGRVVDEKGLPMPGVNIRTKDGYNGTITDAKGEFTLKKIDNTAILIISFIGYLNQEVNANSDLSSIKLTISNSKLDEVQIQAYGITSRRLSTGNIGTVKAADIEKQPVGNPLLALIGRVPGLQISQSTGVSGGGIILSIQGLNSIAAGGDPFYVIDGVPFSSQKLASLGENILKISSSNPLGNTLNTGYGNPLSFINPLDIESIDILKDADATAIYGSRAANGAILITTKKGKTGQTKVDINLQNGFGDAASKMKLLNTQQYLEVRNEALKNDGIGSPRATDYDLNGAWGNINRNTDWQEALIGKTSKYNDFQGTISGGTQNTTFLIGADYHRETTVFPGEFADIKGSGRFNITNISTNKRFHVSLTGSYLADKNTLPSTDLTGTALGLPPNAPQLYNPDGTLNWAIGSNGNSTWYNPLAYTLNTYKLQTNSLTSSAQLGYVILNGLEISSNLGYNDMQSVELATNPLISSKPESRLYIQSSASYGNTNSQSWSIEPQIKFNHDLFSGSFEALFGTSFQKSTGTVQYISGYGYNSDTELQNVNAAETKDIDFNSNVYKYSGTFGRLNYNLQDKYILNITARRDGSSRFGSANKFHDFGATGFAWLFSNESFIKKSLPWLSFGKLKVSYGTTGNDQIGDYLFLSTYITPPGRQNLYQNSLGLTQTNLTNQHLKWEETHKLNIGLDVGLLKDRIIINANYYNNHSSSQLLSYALPGTTGFTGITANLDALIQNQGIELTLNTVNISSPKFRWSSSFNISKNKNTLVSFPKLSSSSYANDLIIGQPVAILKLYKYLDVDRATGIYRFLDKNGNITSDPGFGNENRTQIYDPMPKFYGGFQNSLSYNGFSLDFVLQFVKQTAPNRAFGLYPGRIVNQPESVLDRWRQASDEASIQKYSTNKNSLQNYYASASNAGYSDASFIRLKNVALSWEIPEAWRQRLKVKNARIYINGQNLLTFTKYIGLDPETRSFDALPPLRIISTGMQLTF
jgi:TonB-linked SusC/RagA family outer membrane protein